MALEEGEAAAEALPYVTKTALLYLVTFLTQAEEGGSVEVRHFVEVPKVVGVFAPVE